MIRGIENFREWFYGYEDRYVIIGGTACDLLMSEEGLDFRATKDIDLVLIIEALDAGFGKRFWEYILTAGTELLESNVQPFTLSERIKADMREFLDRMVSEEVDLKQIGISDKTKDIILGELREIYQ